jgi:dipeptidyl aminopeptidase/acylaminoacyl peptidase
MKTTLRLLACCLCFLVPAHAQKRLAPLPVADLLDARSVGGKLSAHGDWVAFTLRDPRRAPAAQVITDAFRDTGVVWWAVGGDIVILNSRTGETKNLTGGQSNNWSPAWSPDGRYLAFYSDRTAGRQGRQARLWVWERASGRLRQLSGEVIRAFADSEIQWTPDSRQLLVKLLPAGMTAAAFHQTVSPAPAKPEQADAKNETTVKVYRSHPEKSSSTAQTEPVGAWSLEPYQADLALIEVANGRVRRLASKVRCARQALSPGGNYVAFSSPQRFAKTGTQQMLFDLLTIRLKDGQTRTVATDVPMNTGSHFRWSPDETRLTWQTGGMTAVSEVFVSDVATGVPRLLTGQPHPRFEPYVAQSPLWDAAGKTLYFIGAGALWRATLSEPHAGEFVRLPEQRIEMIEDHAGQVYSPDGGQSIVVVARHLKTKQGGFYRIDLATRAATKLFAGDVIIEGVAAAREQLLYLAQSARQSADVWRISADGQSVKRVSQLNPQLDEYEMGEPRVIEWQTAEGQTLRGALLLPAGYRAGQRYPLIVRVYAGRAESNDLNFFGLSRVSYANAQLLATRGYAVLLPDAPQKLGTPMADIAKAVLPAVDKVIELGIADAERLGVVGQSYGGYSTLSLIVQTTRFKAAVMSAGFGNLFTIYSQLRQDGSTHGLTLMENGQGLMGGTPWEYRQRYLENSPFFFLDQVQTPLLILHGTGDDTVNSTGGDEVFVGLRRLGKKVVYARYEGEGHTANTWRRPNQFDFLERMLAWFDEHLKPREAGMK